MGLRLRPWTVRAALPFVLQVHRRLPKVQGALWAVSVRNDDGEVVGCALVGNPAREWMEDNAVLAVLRVAVKEGNRNACSMLYGACSRAAAAMGADDLVTYLHDDESGVSLKAAGWIDGGPTDGGEWDRPGRPRQLSIDPQPKRRWFAPWGRRAGDIVANRLQIQRDRARLAACKPASLSNQFTAAHGVVSGDPTHGTEAGSERR